MAGTWNLVAALTTSRCCLTTSKIINIQTLGQRSGSYDTDISDKKNAQGHFYGFVSSILDRLTSSTLVAHVARKRENVSK